MSGSPREHRVDFIEVPAKSIESLKASQSFYQSVFGWSFQQGGDDYIDTSGSGVGFGVNADSTHRPKAPLVVLFASDLERSLERVVEAGGKITKDIFAFPGGRRFHFRDPAGNELAIWSDK